MSLKITDQTAEKAFFISRELWEHPELSGEEYRSAEFLAEQIAAEGFQVTKGVTGLETAFVAEWTPVRSADKRSDGPEVPTVAFLAEYDALPGYGELSPDGSGNAHACGHNWISAAAYAAAVTLKQAVEEAEKKGERRQVRILLVGTPAEETWGGKISMCREGLFRELSPDAVFEAHLSGQPKHCFTNYLLALTNIRYTFRGKASHASAHPENGINALDALNLTFAGIACLRQHVLPGTKLHGKIVEGGLACNIIPDTGVMDYYVRAPKKDYLEKVLERVNDCARGAALMTGCRVEIGRDENTFYDMRNNMPLNARAEEHLMALAEADREAAAAEGRDFAMSGEIREDDLFTAPSGDIGNVSYEAPSFYGVFSTAPVSGGADIHDREYLAVTDSEYAHHLLKLAAGVMASTGLDILTDADFRVQCREAFLKQNS